MLWPDDWDLCPKYDCRDRELSPHRLQDRFSARQWLRQFKNNIFKMLAMRRLLSGERSAWKLCLLSDDAVIDHIADLLVSRRLHVHARSARAAFVTSSQSQGSTASSHESAERIVLFPISQRKRPAVGVVSSREPVMDSDPPTFPANSDSAAQAATLVAAAETGAAACYI